MQGHSQLLVGGQCIVAEGDHGLNLPGSGRLFPELAGLRLAAADAAALIDAVRQQSQRLGVALVGGTLVIVNGLIPPAVAGSLVTAGQLICAGGVEVPPRRAEQPLQDGIVQRGGIRPWVDDHAVQPFGVQGVCHGFPHPALGHGAGGSGALGLRRLHRGEQRQVGALPPGVEKPRGQVFCLFLRDGERRPRGRTALGVGGGIQRHQHPCFQLQRIVQGVHQVPEMRLALVAVEPRHSLFHHRAAGAGGTIFRGGLFLPASHRAEPPCAFLVCHLHHPSFSIRHNSLL